MQETITILSTFVALLTAAVKLYHRIIESGILTGKKRISKLQEAVRCEFMTELTRSHLEEILVAEHFYKSTGIRTEKQLREAIINEFNKANGELRFIHFKRALPHLHYKNSKIFVKISKFESLSYWSNIVIAVFFALIAAGISSTPVTLFLKGELTKGLHASIQPFFILFLGFIVFTQTFSVYSAKLIKEQIEQCQHECIFCKTYYIKDIIVWCAVAPVKLYKFLISKLGKLFKRKKQSAPE